jgi:hypothetical protein
LEFPRDLLLSNFGQMLRPLLVADSHASQVGQAIEKLRPQSARWSVVRN